MGKRRRKRGRKANRGCVRVPASLGKWGAMFTSRGNEILHLTVFGPTVDASTPAELERATAAALG